MNFAIAVCLLNSSDCRSTLAAVVLVMQAYVENKVEGLEDQLRKMKTQVDDLTRTNGELVNTRNRVTTENSELQRQIRDLENNYGAFSKNKGQLQTQLDDTKSKLEEEMRVNLYLVSLCLLGPFSPCRSQGLPHSKRKHADVYTECRL